MKKLLAKIQKLLRDRRVRGNLRRLISGFAAVVIFVTTYALVLPAITMEKNALCGIEEHVHTDECYTEELICGMPESAEHHHSESCYKKILICGKEMHIHSKECYIHVDEENDPGAETVAAESSAGTAATADVFDEISMDSNESELNDEFGADGDEWQTEVSEDSGYAEMPEEYMDGEESVEDAGNARYTESEDSAESSMSLEKDKSTDSTEFSDDVEFADSADYEAVSEDGVSVMSADSENNTDDFIEDAEDYDAEYIEVAEEGKENGKSTDAAYEQEEDGSEQLYVDFADKTEEAAETENTEETKEAAETENTEETKEAAETENSEETEEAAETENSEETEEAAETENSEEIEEAAGTEYIEETPKTENTEETEEAAETENTGETEEAVGTEYIEETPETENTEETEEAAGTENTGETEEAAGTEYIEETPEAENTEETGEAAETGEHTPTQGDLIFETVLDENTGIYFYDNSENETVENSSAVTAWAKVEEDTILSPEDLIRVYLRYTIPAGSLNADKDIARYRLPGNLHLSDDQIVEIDSVENGISGSYVNYETQEITVPEKWQYYLGAEAIEGERTPDQPIEEYFLEHQELEDQEYISATVKAENVFDEQTEEYMGQDLIFTFSPYTIEKNRNEYDDTGGLTKAGEEVTGWFSFDLNMGQVDWSEPEMSEVEKAAEKPALDTETAAGETETTADKAETTTEGAVTAAGETEITADKAETTTEGAVTAAGEAETTADKAETTKEGAVTAAGEAETTADGAGASSEETKGAVDDGQTGLKPGANDEDSSADGQKSEIELISEKTAEIVFADERFDEQGHEIGKIEAVLKLVEKTTVFTGTENENTAGESEDPGQDDINVPVNADEEENRDDHPVNKEGAQEDASGSAAEESVQGTGSTEEKTDGAEQTVGTASNSETDADSAEKDSAVKTEEAQEDTPVMPAMSFFDTIRVSTGRPSGIDRNTGGILADASNALPQEAELSVRVEADEGTFPAGTTMVLSAVNESDMDALAEKLTDAVDNKNAAAEKATKKDDTEKASKNVDAEKITKNAAVENTADNAAAENENKNLKTYGFQAVDISFFDEDGKEIEPAKPVRVAMTSTVVEQAKKDAADSAVADPVVVHVDDKGNAEQIDQLDPEQIKPAQGRTEQQIREDRIQKEENKEEKNLPEEESNGDQVPEQKTDEKNLPEEESGENQLPDPQSTVGFETDSFSIYAIVYTVDFHYEVNEEMYDFSIPGGGFVSLAHIVEVLGISGGETYTDNPDENRTETSADKAETGQDDAVNEDIDSDKITDDETADQEAIRLNDAQISEETWNFLADVKSVEFSKPELVWVGKAENDTTVGDLKKANSLDVEYSADLTERQIDDINAQAIKAGDWALISLNAFSGLEKLVVTMQDGARYVIKVTDAQIAAKYLSKSGETWNVRVIYGDDAGIPEDAKLQVREIVMSEPDAAAAEGAGDEYGDYLTKSADLLRHSEKDVSYARYFDITILDAHGSEIQPKSEVQVEISLTDPLGENRVNLLHFDDDSREAELMESSRIGDTLRFGTSGFSVYGAVVIKEEEGTFVFKGDGYTVSVSYTKEAKIPLGTVLEVSEVEQGTDEYYQYFGNTWNEVNKNYFEVEKQLEEYEEWMGEVPQAQMTNLDSVRFFNVALEYEGKKVDPLVPVQVSVDYDEGLFSLSDSKPGMVQLTETETLIKDDTVTVVEDNGAKHFSSKQSALLVVGTFTSHETSDMEPQRKKQSVSAIPQTDVDISSLMLRSSGDEDGTEPLPSTQDNTGIDKPSGTKTLTPNSYGSDDQNDGTYTLTLTVKGHSNTTVHPRDRNANVLFVMDRSSSMITNFVDDGKDEGYWYYGTRNSAEFRRDIGDPDHNTGKNYQFYYKDDNGEYQELNVSFWNGYGYSWDSPTITYTDGTPYPGDGDLWVKSKTTRLRAEQDALDDVVGRLLSCNTASNPTNVEISVISFANQRGDHKSWASETETGWIGGNSTTGVMNAVNKNFYSSGTNWEEALQYANEVISGKKQTDGTGEDYFIVFLTDGEPTQDHANNGTTQIANADAYNSAKDDARSLVTSGYTFYNIFTFRKDSESVGYSIRLTNYAYGKGEGDTLHPDAAEYFSDARTVEQLNSVFDRIFVNVANTIGHGNVSVTDTLTTDAMTTTVVKGQTSGYVYEVTDGSGTTIYKVNATGSLPNPEAVEPEYPTVTFTVPGSSMTTYTASPSTVNGKTVYSVTTVEGDTYKMALADIDDETGEIVWDLAPVGILMDDCTYSVSFIVWPDQEAYNYVAALNNGLTTIENLSGETEPVEWNQDEATEVTGLNGSKYYKGGCTSHPSIVYYPGENDDYENGVYNGTFAVLTNTEQKIHYSVIETRTENGVLTGDPVITGPFYEDLQTPDPMPLTAAKSKLEKAWNVERDPGILAQLLYDTNGNPTKFAIDYAIICDGEDEPYTTMTLGWDEDQGKYIWEPDSEQEPNTIRQVVYNGKIVEIGMRWVEKFDIASGLMLSETRMDDLGINKTLYDYFTYGTDEPIKYYLLEPGHDYTLEEIVPEGDESWVTYEFDFIAPVYHPMLVDGKLKSVTFNKENGSITGIKEISESDWLVSLKMENTLRGYIHLRKKIVDKDGRTPVSDYDTKFKYSIVLENATDPGPFTGDSIPWYGVDGLFYHDADFNYYQAETHSETHKSHTLTLTTRSGDVFNAWCTDASGVEDQTLLFDEDIPGPTWVTYNDGDRDVTIQVYGNELACANPNIASTELWITQNELLSIANVPVGTTYSITEDITEASQEGYDLLSIYKEIKNGDVVESSETVSDISAGTISGTIAVDRDNNITYTNKIHSVDITVKKIDDDNMPLSGAQFTLTKARAGNETENTVYTRPADGETDTGTYLFADLPDGNYTLEETVVPNGFTGLPGTVNFTIADGKVSGDMNLPSGVSWDGSNLTFTVKNTASDGPGSITVRKQWLDFYGDAMQPDNIDDIELTLKRKKDTPRTKPLNFEIKINGKSFSKSASWDITNESVIVQWNDGGQYSFNPGRGTWTVNDSAVTVTSVTGNGSNNTPVRLRVNGLGNATADTVEITFTYGANMNSNDAVFADWFANTLSNSDVSFTPVQGSSAVQYGGGEPVEDQGFSDTLTLESDNGWSITKTVGGREGTVPLNYDYPAEDGSGNAYHYYIYEAPIEGYTVTYSQNNDEGTLSGILTAYNKSTYVDLILEKINKDNASMKLNGATFVLRQIDPTKTGNMDTRGLQDGKTDTQTTSGEGNNKGTLTFASLGPGYYEIKENQAPEGYILIEDTTFYVRVTESAVQLLEKDESIPADQWGVISESQLVAIRNMTVTVGNESGPELPSTGGPGTRIFTILGSLLTAFAGAVILLKKYHENIMKTQLKR